MHFAVFATDRAGMGEVRARERPRHRLYLRDPDPHRVRVLLGGPTLDAAGEAMNGTLLVVEAASLAEVEAFLADDPYAQAALFARVEVRPWHWTLGRREDDGEPA
jgi:uncharacterized protein YciI